MYVSDITWCVLGWKGQGEMHAAGEWCPVFRLVCVCV